MITYAALAWKCIQKHWVRHLLEYRLLRPLSKLRSGQTSSINICYKNKKKTYRIVSIILPTIQLLVNRAALKISYQNKYIHTYTHTRPTHTHTHTHIVCFHIFWSVLIDVVSTFVVCFDFERETKRFRSAAETFTSISKNIWCNVNV